MDSKIRNIGIARPRAKTYYERWMEKEGVPIVEGYGVTDVRKIALTKWPRLGCDGAYLQFRGLEGITGVYVGKIAPGASSEPERHLYEKVIYILQGKGVAEIQQRDRVPQVIAWQPGSLFSPPMNTLHRLINHANEPALFLAVTTAPMALDHYHNEKFIFNSDFSFNDRYDARDELFRAEQRSLSGGEQSPMDLGDELHSRRAQGRNRRAGAKGRGRQYHPVRIIRTTP